MRAVVATPRYCPLWWHIEADCLADLPQGQRSRLLSATHVNPTRQAVCVPSMFPHPCRPPRPRLTVRQPSRSLYETPRGRWLHVRCRCGHTTPQPVRLMLIEHPELARESVADVLVGLRCSGCHGRRLRVWLCEGPHGPGAVPRSIAAGWTLLLHDGAGPEPDGGPGAAAAAE